MIPETQRFEEVTLPNIVIEPIESTYRNELPIHSNLFEETCNTPDIHQMALKHNSVKRSGTGGTLNEDPK